MSRGHEITATAGLHRQVWISGTNLLADVHIMNNSRKPVKKIELQLERRVLCYKHVSCYIISILILETDQSDIFRLLLPRSKCQQAKQEYSTKMSVLLLVVP